MSTIASVIDEAEKPRTLPVATPFGCPRNYLGNRFVYTRISARARGLCVGINMNPDGLCNFDCLYCDVSRDLPHKEQKLDIAQMATELEQTLFLVRTGK